MILQVKDFSVHYGKVSAVNKINLAAQENKIVAVLGSNGAGKSSTMNGISGLNDVTGEIWFDGERIDGLKPHEIASRGVIQIPGGGGILSQLTVFENLKIGAYLVRDKKFISEKLEDIYSLFPVLHKRRNKRADGLSGGERAMLAFGRALMARPRLLMMDEPTMGLSPAFCKQVEKLIERINQEPMTIILVAQNARMALSISNYAYVLEKGKVVIEGASDQLIDDDTVRKAYLGV